MAGVTVFSWIYDNSLQQNKNTMFDDKEQVFCEEKKKGLFFTGCVTENGINSNENGYSLRELCYNSLWFIAAEKSGQFIASLLNALLRGLL